MLKPFVLHTSALNAQGCPIDPTSPVPPPWDSPPSGEGRARTSASPEDSRLSRVSEIGQMVAKYARNPELRPYERLFRSEPNEAWFDLNRNPSNPTQFEIGSVAPTKGSSLLIMDYSVRPYGFSGLTPLDFEGLEDDRISGCFAYSLSINGNAPGILQYQLDPVRSTIQQQSMKANQRLVDMNNLTSDDYVISRAAEYASAAGLGTSLHPQTAERFGGRIIPFGEFIHDNQQLTIGGVIYRAVEVPLSFIQVRFSGFQMTAELAGALQQSLRNSIR